MVSANAKYVWASKDLCLGGRALTVIVGDSWEVDAFGDGEIILRTNHEVGVIRRVLMWVVLGSKWRYLGEGRK